MQENTKRYFSVTEMNKIYGIPVTMMRRGIKQGIVPGFRSGTWFHIDGPAYLEMLSQQNTQSEATNEE